MKICYNMKNMEDNAKSQFDAYIDKIKGRAKKSRVHSRHQMIGLMIADILGDPTHKSLYIKMARDENSEKMLYMAKSVAENSRIKNKGAYFMKIWHLSTPRSVKQISEKHKVDRDKKAMQIITIKNKNSAILKHKMPDFDFNQYNPEQIKDTITEMRKVMKASGGVGLSANQVGLEWRMFIAEHNNKFYSIFNPQIIKHSEKMSVLEEGCLSVPDTSLAVSRYESIVLQSQNKKGKVVKFRVCGILARIFQHETDHLDGKLIISK